MKSALITGGEGIVGKLIRDSFAYDSYDIVNGDNIFDSDNLRRRMEGKDLVIHLAAIPCPLPKPTALDYWTLNHKGTVAVVEAMLSTGVKKLIYSSSGMVYGMRKEPPFVPKYLPLDEKHPLPKFSEIHYYTQTKIACESFLMKLDDITSVIFRINLPGWDLWKSPYHKMATRGTLFFGGVRKDNLNTLFQLAAGYEGSSVILNTGDGTLHPKICPDTIKWAEENYPESEIRLEGPHDPLYSVKKAVRILGYDSE